MVKLFIYIYCILIFNCVPSLKIDKICDVKSEGFKNAILVKLATNDRSAYCSLSFRGNSPSTNPPNPAETVATPVFSPVMGHYSTPQDITVSTTTPGAIIYLSFDGLDPTSNSTIFTQPGKLWIAAGVPLKAIAIKDGLSSSIASTIYTYSTLKTGQTVQSAAGDDGALQLGVPRSFTDNADGTVTDIATSLIWQKCSKGLSGGVCGTGTIQNELNGNAQTYCNGLNLAGKTWRLPSKFELESLIDFAATPTNLNTSFFPNTAANFYWTSTIDSSDNTRAVMVNFANGNVTSQTFANPYGTRCVSGGLKNAAQKFTDNNDGTIKDNNTGLVWQKCSRGQADDPTCTGTIAATTWTTIMPECSAINLAGRVWRMPNINELASIVDFTKTSGPKINTTIFPNFSGGTYWTSTTFANSQKGAVDFNSGFISSFTPASSYNRKCVSGP